MRDFYLGRFYDSKLGRTTAQQYLYNSDHLTTHGVIVGMTGSGKTGLCLDLMEEAALQKIPSLMIDPKGDITNLLLHFPDLLPADFQPWINEVEAQRAGKTVAESAAETAELWRNGLAQWEIEPSRIARLKEAVQYTIYTPGSDSGRPISILASLAAPAIDWESNKELLRERISGTVTALLGLVGRTDIDPVRDREHILLANIFEHAWSQGKDLTLGDLIMQVQSPPFTKLGFFDVTVFFPDKDRFSLALALNNILASPAFQSWMMGEPLDIQKMMYTPEGKPRHTIFYIAHLNDTERMFFVTLLYSSVETWMRTQSGTGSLRALVYFDEIFGYLPPTANPPSKEPLLRLLKQARAFGVGMVLATQNPVDIDYKGLSNAGTWFIGKLGTDRDKQRLLDGLESITGGIARADLDRLISGLDKRVFLVRNVNNKEPLLFQTRWAMNYLAGPITRTRIAELNRLAGADQPLLASSTPSAVNNQSADAKPAAIPTDTAKSVTAVGTSTRPKVPARVAEYFLPINQPATDGKIVETIYRPILLAQAVIRTTNRKYNIDLQQYKLSLVSDPDRRGMVRWQDYQSQGVIDVRNLDDAPDPDATFGDLQPPLSDATILNSLKRDFEDWVFRTSNVMIQANEALGVYAGPEVSAEAFSEQCNEAAELQLAAETKKLDSRFEVKLATLQRELEREKQELADDEDELSRRKREEGVKHIETALGMLGLFGRKKSISGSMSKRSLTERAKEEVDESVQEISRLEKAVRELLANKEDEVAQLEEKWQQIAQTTTTIQLQPFKKDVVIDLFGVAWLPHYLMEKGATVEAFIPDSSNQG